MTAVLAQVHKAAAAVAAVAEDDDLDIDPALTACVQLALAGPHTAASQEPAARPSLTLSAFGMHLHAAVGPGPAAGGCSRGQVASEAVRLAAGGLASRLDADQRRLALAEPRALVAEEPLAAAVGPVRAWFAVSGQRDCSASR